MGAVLLYEEEEEEPAIQVRRNGLLDICVVTSLGYAAKNTKLVSLLSPVKDDLGRVTHPLLAMVFKDNVGAAVFVIGDLVGLTGYL